MNWEKLIEKYDNKHILRWIEKFPDQCIEAVYWGKKFQPKKRKIDKIVACGMGGSGIGAAVLRNLLKQELDIPFETYNSYELPKYIDRNTLVFCISFSGNTEETIECFKQAKKKRAYVISITTNGKLKKMAGKDCITIPKSSPQPRMALAYLSLPMLIVLQKMKLVEKQNGKLNETVLLLRGEAAQLNAKAKELAEKMKGKLPIIYASEELQTVAYRFRTEINENAKQFSLNHFLPEQNHNEVSAKFGLKRKDCEIFLLRHDSEHKKVTKRFGILKKIMKHNFNITEVNLKGKSLLATTFYSIQLAALTSYYLALLNKIDPEPVPTIGLLKKQLKK